MKKLIIAGLVAATFGAALPAAAKTNVEIIVDTAPPPARYEVVPAPRAGSTWVPGYWEWRHGKHYWVRGQWVRHRAGYVYEPARWVEHDGRWRYVAPVWRTHKGDRDGDGVPNRYDSHPDNPYRR
jgi:hypothetical protein